MAKKTYRMIVYSDREHKAAVSKILDAGFKPVSYQVLDMATRDLSYTVIKVFCRTNKEYNQVEALFND